MMNRKQRRAIPEPGVPFPSLSSISLSSDPAVGGADTRVCSAETLLGAFSTSATNSRLSQPFPRGRHLPGSTHRQPSQLTALHRPKNRIRPGHLFSKPHHPRPCSSQRYFPTPTNRRPQWLRSVKNLLSRRTRTLHRNRIHIGRHHGRIPLARKPRANPPIHLFRPNHRPNHQRKTLLPLPPLPNHPHPRLSQIPQRSPKAKIRKAQGTKWVRSADARKRIPV